MLSGLAEVIERGEAPDKGSSRKDGDVTLSDQPARKQIARRLSNSHSKPVYS